MNKKAKNVLKALLLLLCGALIVVLIYFFYVLLSFNRIPDNTELTVENNQTNVMKENVEYTAVTYNLGFGCYSKDFSFFLDSADWKDGSHTTGKYGKGITREDVIENIEDQAAVLRDIAPDFILLQEVDTDSSRSYHIDMATYFEETFPFMNSVFAINFHSPWLNLPLFDPIGVVNSGVLTLSRFKTDSAVRRSYPIASDFSKLFDLDRCFSVERIPVEGGKTLVLVNSHMSAYDEGGVIRAQQLELLSSFMEEEYKKGNWVIIGGDFNHVLGKEYQDAFPSEQVVPVWAYILDNNDLPEHYSIVKPENGMEESTCRNADTPYIEGVNYSTIIDGFIVSDNVEAKAEVYHTGYEESDHQPVVLTFSLK